MLQQDYWNKVGMAKYYSHMYYVKSNPVISDQEFDALVDEIAKAEEQHPDWTLPDSPTQKVGSDLSDNGRRRIAHRTPMLSCQKAQTVEAVDKWLVKIRPNIRRDLGRFLLMWKYDGISCSLVYQDGKLIEASTRGEDGLIGQDILDHVRMMQNVPQQLEATNDFMRKSNALKGRIEVRGEVVCKKANLKLMRNQYKDCRSAASSLCNMMEPDPDCELLQFCVWDVIADRWNYGPEANIGLDMAKASGFKDVYYVCNNLEDGYHFGDTLQRYFDAEKREALAFPTDGVVIRVNHRGDFKALGATAHHPKGSIAYKFAAAKTVSRVTRIEVTVGKTGRRTPVVHFEPVMILGREVKKASLGSERMLQEMGVKRGDMVEVGLANDVRPTIYRVIETTDCMDSTDMADPLEGIDFEGDESETKDWFTSEEEANTDCTDETDDVEEETTNFTNDTNVAPEVTAEQLEAAVKACEDRRGAMEQEAREKAATGLEIAHTDNTDHTDNSSPAESAEIAESSNKQSKALKIGAAIVGVLVIAVCGITALAASVFLAPVLVGAFKG
jgi:NAD-dependent DNA ligase